MRSGIVLFLLLCFTSAFQAVQAQQYWLQPDTFLVNKKQPLTLKIASGDSLQANGKPDRARLIRFVTYQKKDSLNQTSLFTGTSASLSGNSVSGLTLAAATLQLPDADIVHALFLKDFTREQKDMLKYLDTTILRGNIPTEHFIYAKTLLSDGSRQSSEVFKQMLDHPLEIMLLVNPFTHAIGKIMPVQLIYDRKVMAFKTFYIYHKDPKGNIKKYTAKTTKAGAGSFTIKGPGQYLVYVSHAGPLPTPNPEEVKWQQLEATYTFYIADPNPAPKTAPAKKK